MSNASGGWGRMPLNILTIAWLEVRNILRESTSLGLIFSVPLVQILLFGFAIELIPRNVPLAVAGPDSAQVTRARVIDVARETGYFKVLDHISDAGDAARSLEAGEALIALELAPKVDPFSELEGGSTPVAAPPRLIIDGTEPTTVGPALGALQEALLERLLDVAAGSDLAGLTVDQRYNPENRAEWMILPALTGVVAMISMLLLSSLSVVRERESGTWEALMVLPFRRTEILAGKMLPYLVLGCLQVFVIVLVSYGVFGVPVRGNLFAFAAFVPLFVAAHLAIGLAVSAAAKSQVQAVEGAVMFYLPCVLLSGFMFPFSGMPGWARGFAEVLPLTHFSRIARGVMVRGEGVGLVLAEAWPVALFFIAASILAVAAFKRRLG